MKKTTNSPVKHTPGPWLITRQRHHLDNPEENFCITIAPVISEEGSFRGDICHMQSCEHIGGIAKQELLANARLIAAAPELLEALNALESLSCDPAGSQLTLREIFGTFHREQQIEGKIAIAAIARATGAVLAPETNLAAPV